MRILLIAAMLLLTSLGAKTAETQQTSDKLADAMLKGGVNSQVLTMEGGYSPPAIRPKLANLRRGYTPNAENLITKFLGGRQTLIGGGESVVSPIWGKGTRYKSGSVVYAIPVDNKNQRFKDLSQYPKLESVPAYLDVYGSGFLYTNNIEHKGVIATDVKIKGKADSDITYKQIFSPKDGQATVEQMLPGMVGEVKVPQGFRKSISHHVQNFGERLYAYRVTPEYVTSYTETKNGKNVEKPVAIPVLDSYVHVLLDGDKVLAGMEYFWDNNLSVEGTPKACIQAGEAVGKAREWLIKRHNGSPPLYNVSNIRLGYIQDRSDRNRLVPAWIFDAWYIVPLPSAVGTSESPVKRINEPFAINALTGEPIKLSL